MKEQLINYETAKLASEKGFIDKDCRIRGYLKEFPTQLTYSTHIQDGFYYFPSQTILQKWLRETHNIHCNISVEFYKTGINYLWQVLIYDPTDNMCVSPKSSGLYGDNGEYESYEDALEKCLYHALTLIN